MRIFRLILKRIVPAALVIFFAGGFGTCGVHGAATPAPATSPNAQPAQANTASRDLQRGGTVVTRSNAGPTNPESVGSAAESKPAGGVPGLDSVPEIILDETPSGVALFESGLFLPRPVTFAQGSGKDIVESDLPILQDLSRLLREHPGLKIVILGHSSAEEAAPYGGADLSIKRAQTVRDFLARSGVSADRVRIGGAGDGSPLRTSGPQDDPAKNSRVEIFQIR